VCITDHEKTQKPEDGLTPNVASDRRPAPIRSWARHARRCFYS